MRKLWVADLLAFVLILFLLWNIRPIPSQLETHAFKGKTSSKGLTVQFLGNTNVLLDDGETRILTDGFFSRPPVTSVVFGEVSPNKERIKKCLKRAKINDLDLVIPVHSHYDHAMDAPVVAQLTGATLMGSSSTLNIGRGLKLSEDQLMEAPLNEFISIGKFEIMFIASKHWTYPDPDKVKRLLNQSIDAPLVPPASIYDYKEGISYSILIRHEEVNIAIQGSAGYKKNVIPDFDADVQFLAIAGIELMNDSYNQDYQKHVIDAVDPEVIVPIHWDDFTIPLEDGLKTTNLLVNLNFGSNLGHAFNIIESNNPNREIVVLPLWRRVAVKDLMK
ncbi:MAG: MBL fold metallo-hydrolase [Crocinitomicaceae bacterium]|nr:MBL fold metallo-hydrolase [Crocinitomicaceae bacterium]